MVACAPRVSVFYMPIFILTLTVMVCARLECQCSIGRHLFLLRLWWHGAPWWCSIGRHSCAPSVSVFYRPIFVLTPTVMGMRAPECQCSIGRHLFFDCGGMRAPWCSIGRHLCAPSVSVFHRPFILTPTVVACASRVSVFYI